MNPIADLRERGQSVWLDYIHRRLLEQGDLARLAADGISGVTSNPAIFEQAISGSDAYDRALAALLDASPHADAVMLYETLAVEDIRHAADVLLARYETTQRADGYVSLEVSPHLAHQTEGTIEEARRLWDDVDRPNLMIKVPATVEGIPAIETLVAEGINVNATLVFSLGRYEEVARAYLRGLQQADDPSRPGGVASFFVSRIDTAIDRLLEQNGSDEALAMCGTIAIASAKLVNARAGRIFGGAEFDVLRRYGARPQKVLWASTGTKDPRYSDVLYVEELIGPGTVTTMPPATLEAFRDHGSVPGDTLLRDLEGAEAAIAALPALGVDLDAVTRQLLNDGVTAFADAYDRMLASVAEKAERLRSRFVDVQSLALGDYGPAVADRTATWEQSRVVDRLPAGDHTLWSEEPRPEISDRLGWLALPRTMHPRLGEITRFADRVRADGITHVVLLGMGGSSLAPEVFQRTFGNWGGYPELIVLDSTHPAAVSGVDRRVDPPSTLFLVASKSGTTIEPLSLFEYFWERTADTTGTPGRHFAAITDPGSPLIPFAEERGFRRIFEAVPDVGGRYSALTHFGLVPAALIGADVHRLLDRAVVMAEATRLSGASSPAVTLGAVLGELALAGRDKATFVVSSSLAAFPGWVEQLLAESTGKDGRGILPVVDEDLGAPDVYGDDRLFVYLSFAADDDAGRAARIDALEAAGHPVVRIRVDELEDLGSEMYRAEVAVAMAGSVLGIHPFDQPDVELAKRLARQAMAGELHAEPIPEIPAGRHDRLVEVEALLSQARPGAYFALQAFLAPGGPTTEALQRIRLAVRDRLRIATTVGFGPRFLHSTGQLHKGGPDTGLFLQIVDDPAPDLAVPGAGYTFGRLISSQADGDYLALRNAGRRIVRVRLGRDSLGGLEALAAVAAG